MRIEGSQYQWVGDIAGKQDARSLLLLDLLSPGIRERSVAHDDEGLV